MTLPSEDRERLLLTLRRVDPSGFRDQLRAVLLAHEAITSAALALRIAPKTLAAWIAADPSIIAGMQPDP